MRPSPGRSGARRHGRAGRQVRRRDRSDRAARGRAPARGQGPDRRPALAWRRRRGRGRAARPRTIAAGAEARGPRRPPRPQGARAAPAGRRSTRAPRPNRLLLGDRRDARPSTRATTGTDLDAFRGAATGSVPPGACGTPSASRRRLRGGAGRDRARSRSRRWPGLPACSPLLEDAGRLMQFKDLIRGTVLLVAIEATGARRSISAVAINAAGDDTLAALSLGWWLVAIVGGVWIGRPSRTADALRGPLAAAKTSTSCPPTRRPGSRWRGSGRSRCSRSSRARLGPSSRRSRRSRPASRSASRRLAQPRGGGDGDRGARRRPLLRRARLGLRRRSSWSAPRACAARRRLRPPTL